MTLQLCFRLRQQPDGSLSAELDKTREHLAAIKTIQELLPEYHPEEIVEGCLWTLMVTQKPEIEKREDEDLKETRVQFQKDLHHALKTRHDIGPLIIDFNGDNLTATVTKPD